MAIQNPSLVQLGRLVYRVYAESDLVDQPTFYLWLDGIISQRLLGRAKTGGGWYIEVDLSIAEGGTTDISIFDSATDVPADIWPSRFVLQWEREADAEEYWLEENIEDVWILRNVIRETGQWMYWVKTRTLEDCENHTFRIRVKGTNRMMSVARTFIVRCVRRPDRPNVTYTYEGEFLDESDWTSTGWTGSWAAGWKHTPGNTSSLSQAHPALDEANYYVTASMAGRTTGSVIIAFAGIEMAGITESIKGPINAWNTNNLVITPTSDFNGTLKISIVKTGVLSVAAAS